MGEPAAPGALPAPGWLPARRHALLALLAPALAVVLSAAGCEPATVLVILVAACAAVAAWAWGGPLALLLLVFPFGPKIAFGPGNLYLGTALVFVFLALWCCLVVARGGFARALPGRLAWPLAAWLGLLALSSLQHLPDLLAEPSQLLRIAQLGAYLLLLPAACDLAPRGASLRFLLVLPLAAGLAQAVYALVLSAPGPRGFVVGTFDHEHSNFAAEMVLTLLLGLGLVAGMRRWRDRALLAAGLVVAGIALLLSQSRNGLAAAVVGALALAALPGGKVSRRTLALALLAAAVAAVALSPPSLRERLASVVTGAAGSGGDLAVSRRLGTWIARARAFADAPLLGHGAGSQGITDNYYLKVLAEMGVIGLASFLWLAVAVVRECFRLARPAAGPTTPAVASGMWAVSVAVILVMNLAGDFFLVHRVMGSFWILLGLLLGAAGARTAPGEGP